MNEDQLPENRKEVDDQDPNCTIAKAGIMRQTTKTSQMAQNLGLALTK